MSKEFDDNLNDLFHSRRWRLWPIKGGDRTVAWDGEVEYLALVENGTVEKITFERASQAKTLKELLASLRG